MSGPEYQTMVVSPSVEPLLSSDSSPKSTLELGYPPAGASYVDRAYDANTKDVPQEKLLEIARRFQPAIWVTPNEQFLPCTVDWYLDHVNLYYGPDGTSNPKEYILVKERPVQEDLTPEKLAQLLEAVRVSTQDPRLQGINAGNLDCNNFHMALRADEDQHGVSMAEMNRVPFLTRVRRHADHWEIVYVFWWAYNGPFRICCSWLDAHSCDIEHITVRTNADATKLEWVYYGAHGVCDGVWRQPHQIEVLKADMPEPTRPVGYAADHSHGMYPSAGTWWRICGFANDVAGPASADKRSLWSPTVDPVLLYNMSDPRFLSSMPVQYIQQYKGTFGEDGGRPPSEQPYWDVETTWDNNFFRRCLWPCRYIECGGCECCYNSCQRQVDFTKTQKMTR